MMHQVREPAGLEQWGRPMWWTIGPAQELAVLVVAHRHLTRPSTIAGWLGWMPEVPFDGVLVVRRPDGSVHHRTIPSIPIRPSHIALQPGDRLLIANGRARMDGQGSWESNAVVYAPGRVDLDRLRRRGHLRRPPAVHGRARRLGRPGPAPLDAGRAPAAVAPRRVQRRHRRRSDLVGVVLAAR
ncbi:hypothetical protein AB0K00_38035 [Dactylosporangium sp. NPDC049525]|uniref:hypothetical protein n=1 Tax=Dactylosporangium sp. NPDC049525 TaxID=3154730 RepID=UPI003432BE4B